MHTKKGLYVFPVCGSSNGQEQSPLSGLQLASVAQLDAPSDW